VTADGLHVAEDPDRAGGGEPHHGHVDGKRDRHAHVDPQRDGKHGPATDFEGDTIANFENVVGTFEGDSITGDDNANELVGQRAKTRSSASEATT
jgi:hypothetical protein